MIVKIGDRNVNIVKVSVSELEDIHDEVLDIIDSIELQLTVREDEDWKIKAGYSLEKYNNSLKAVKMLLDKREANQ